jgi:hypothetical protein
VGDHLTAAQEQTTNTEAMNDEITVYCVKYALTVGIVQYQGSLLKSGNFYGKPASGLGHSCALVLGKKEFCYTIEDAMRLAEEVRTRKIASLEKQLAKVRSMTIKVKQP